LALAGAGLVAFAPVSHLPSEPCAAASGGGVSAHERMNAIRFRTVLGARQSDERHLGARNVAPGRPQKAEDFIKVHVPPLAVIADE